MGLFDQLFGSGEDNARSTPQRTGHAPKAPHIDEQTGMRLGDRATPLDAAAYREDHVCRVDPTG